MYQEYILKIVGEHLSNGRHKKGKAKKKKPSNEEDQQAEKEEELGHVMISYQWGNQKVLTEIRDKLIDNGLKVHYLQKSLPTWPSYYADYGVGKICFPVLVNEKKYSDILFFTYQCLKD